MHSADNREIMEISTWISAASGDTQVSETTNPYINPEAEETKSTSGIPDMVTNNKSFIFTKS